MSEEWKCIPLAEQNEKKKMQGLGNSTQSGKAQIFQHYQ